jgi:hypothetical protein
MPSQFRQASRLVDLEQDAAEMSNVALDHPDVAAAMQEHRAQRCKP